MKYLLLAIIFFISGLTFSSDKKNNEDSSITRPLRVALDKAKKQIGAEFKLQDVTGLGISSKKNEFFYWIDMGGWRTEDSPIIFGQVFYIHLRFDNYKLIKITRGR